MAKEIGPIQKLAWAIGDSLKDAAVTIEHGGKTFVAHRTDGSCIFLNASNGRCRIHEQFGEEAKPLGCRLYPFQIQPTFNGEATVTARFDCPSVRKNTGAPHEASLPELRRYASALSLPDAFDDAACCNLERDQIQAVCEFVGTMINGFATDEQRALFIAYLCDALAATGVDELDRSALAESFAPLKRMVEEATATPAKKPGAMVRLAFRMLLGQYLRRDEDVLN